MKFLSVTLVQLVAAFLFTGKLFWPYFAGSVLLMIGLVRIFRDERLQVGGLDRALVFGPLFLAIPMAVFGADHFIAPTIVASLVPSWIPGHLFWVYFVGVALVAASLSIVTGKHSVLAATLLSAMIFSFVLLISVPKLIANPHDRFVFAVLLRDLSFSGGALAYALAQANESSMRNPDWITTLLRYVIAVPAVVFGLEHFLHPEFVPVVPLAQPMPSWIPGHIFLAYLIGAILIVSGLSIIVNWKARLAATWLGIVVFAIVLLVYLPIMVAKASDIGNGLNYLVDTLAFSGTALLLAGVLPMRDLSRVSIEGRRESAAGVDILSRVDARTDERS
jgi:uncharacterized membrane protein